ncbi:tellurite resistance TerB family protein [bacterium]|nr:tellurite resistance TerB family protein [bacterium]
MNISEILGAMVQSGMSASSQDRLKNSLGGSEVLDNLAGAAQGAAGQAGGGIGDLLSSVLSGGTQSTRKGGLGGLLSSIFGGSQKTASVSGGGGMGDLLSKMLGEAGKAVGGQQNLAAGGLGALIGSLLGGGGKSMKGAMGGGVMALLGMLAFNALKSSGQQKPQIPVGLVEPQTEAEKKKLETSSEIVLKAMINATKADGQIDDNEINRILGKFSEVGLDSESQNFLKSQMQQPMETEQLIAAVEGQPELAAQLYAASLLAIEVDTDAEKQYLDQLARGLGLAPEVTTKIQQMVGLQPGL